MKRGELVEWLVYFYTKDVERMPNHGTATDAYTEIWEILKKEVTEEWIEEKAKGVIKKSFKDYETELQAILFVDPIRKSSYRKINKATDTLGEQIWGFIRSLVEEIHGRK